MKHRFESHETQKSGSSWKSPVISMVVFLAVVILFWVGTSLVSDKTDSQQAEILKEAIDRGIVRCYAVEGSYPESLEYLKEHYGLVYDEDRFFIDYQALGSNLRPDVTVIDRRGAK